MGLFDRLDKFYRNNFVSHLDKYKEQNGHYMAFTLNKIWNDEIDPYELPSDLTRSRVKIPRESELYLFNDLPINTLMLVENIAVLSFCHNYAIDGGIEEAFNAFSKRLADGSKGKINQTEAYRAIKDCSNLYKKVFDNETDFPTVLNIYFEGWDVETKDHLLNVFKTFHILQGYVLFIARHLLTKKEGIINQFFKEKAYRDFKVENDLLDSRKLNGLRNDSLTQLHLQLLDLDVQNELWDYRKFLEIIKNVAVHSGYSDDEGVQHHQELISMLDNEVYMWNEAAKLGLVFLNFPSHSGADNASKMKDLIGSIYRIDFVKTI
jgi:hypothetical protein